MGFSTGTTDTYAVSCMLPKILSLAEFFEHLLFHTGKHKNVFDTVLIIRTIIIANL